MQLAVYDAICGTVGTVLTATVNPDIQNIAVMDDSKYPLYLVNPKLDTALPSEYQTVGYITAGWAYELEIMVKCTPDNYRTEVLKEIDRFMGLMGKFRKNLDDLYPDAGIIDVSYESSEVLGFDNAAVAGGAMINMVVFHRTARSNPASPCGDC